MEDHEDSYVNTSEDETVTLEKTYSDRVVLVSLSDADTAIASYPETAAGEVPVEPSDQVEAEANEILDSVSGEGLPAKMVDQVARLEAKRGDCAPTEAAGTDQQEDPLSNLL